MALVHGIISSRYLLPTVRELARFTRVLVPDLPGYRRGDRAKEIPDVATQADAVAAAIAAWSARRVTAVGHSIGAEVVVELARRHPSLVDAAVLVGPTGDPEAAGVLGVWMRWMATAVHEPLSFNLLTVAELAAVGPKRMAMLLRRSFTDPTEAKLSDVRCPTLLVRGTRDRVAPQAWLDRMATHIADAVTVTVADAAHTIVYTHPQEVADLVIRFASGAEMAPGVGPQFVDGEVGVVPDQEPGPSGGPVS